MRLPEGFKFDLPHSLFANTAAGAEPASLSVTHLLLSKARLETMNPLILFGKTGAG